MKLLPVISLLFVSSLPASAVEVESQSVRSGSVKARIAPADGADLVIFYGGEQEGELGVCGCDVNPRGSLARVDGYLRAAAKADPDTPRLLVNAGAWLSNTIGDTTDLRLDAQAANRRMTEAVELAGWNVLNVGYRDMPWFREAALPAGVVSANVRPIDDSEGPATYVVETVGSYRVAITGVSRKGMNFLQPENYRYDDPVASIEALLPEMHASADLVVVLAYDLGKSMNELAKLDIDVVIEAGEYKEQHEPILDNDTLWVRSRWRTERLGELRLFIEDGQIASAVDRMIDMDGDIPASPQLRRLEKRARAEIDQALKDAYGS